MDTIQPYYNGNADIQLAEIQKIGFSDMAIPRMMIVQGTSKMPDAGRHCGDLYNSVTGEFKPSIKAIMVAPAKKLRAVFAVDGEADELLCRSANFMTPIDKYIGKNVRGFEIPASCELCHLKDWHEKEPPQCTMMYNFFFIDIENEMPFTMSFMKTGITAGKNLNTIYVTFGSRAVILLQTVKRDSDKKSYYAPEVLLKREIEIPLNIQSMTEKFVAMQSAKTEADEAQF